MNGDPTSGRSSRVLTARWSPFTSFCEGPTDTEKGFRLFPAFFTRNYDRHLPPDLNAEVLVISSGPGYFQEHLRSLGYTSVLGIDSDERRVAEALGRGLNSEVDSPFERLPETAEYDLIFGEQEVNHLTRDELLDLLVRCYASLKPGGRLILNAANSANPFIATEHPGNNWDHYLITAEGNLTQAFEYAGFAQIMPIPLDFYVLWKNPANYVAKAVTSLTHFLLMVLFRMYGKNARIFTKRLAVVAVKGLDSPGG